MEYLRSTPPTVLLLDMDGVIRHWRQERVTALEARHALPSGAVLDSAFAVAEYADGIVGLASYQRWCDATADALTARFGAAGRAAAAEWRTGRGEIDQAVVSLVRALPEHIRVGLLSNAHDNLRADLTAFGLDDLFEHVVCSAEVGLAKPDPRIYLHAAARFDAPPEHVLFFDDLEENVAAARGVGMRSEQFQTAAALAAALRDARMIGDDLQVESALGSAGRAGLGDVPN